MLQVSSWFNLTCLQTSPPASYMHHFMMYRIKIVQWNWYFVYLDKLIDIDVGFILCLTLNGALVAQSSGKRLSPLRSWVQISVWTRYTHVRRVSLRSAKSRGFSPGTPVSSHLKCWHGLVEDQDRYSANPYIVAVLRNIGSWAASFPIQLAQLHGSKDDEHLPTLLYFTLLYCTLLYFTLLYFTLLYFTLLYFTLLYFTLLYFTLLYFTLLYFTLLYFTLLYFTLLCFALLYFTLLYFALLCVALRCVALRCVALRCVALRCVALRCFALLCFALLYFTLHCFALLCIALLYFTLLYFTLLYFTLLYFTK